MPHSFHFGGLCRHYLASWIVGSIKMGFVGVDALIDPITPENECT